MKRLVFLATVLAAGAACYAADTEPSKPRLDRIEWLINTCMPSVVDTTAYISGANGTQVPTYGAGTIIHEKGYILSDGFVAGGGNCTAALLNGQAFNYRIVWLAPDGDTSIIKVDSPRPLKPMKIGRSNDLMEGETVICIGNPSGVPHTVVNGIISTIVGDRKNPNTIQVNTTVNEGNSGGPLINALGELIGIVNSKHSGVKAISLCIPVDHARDDLAKCVGDVNCIGYKFGAVVNPYGEPRVTEVTQDSPADLAGLKVGDVVTSAGGLRVGDSMHFFVAMLEHQPGDEIPIQVQRDGKAVDLKVILGGKLPYDPVDVQNTVRGLTCSTYVGEFKSCDELVKATPAQTMKTAKISHLAFTPGGNNYGLKFSGYINVPTNGAYRFHVTSDDGSKLFIDNELIVDNDGAHPAKEVSGMTNLKAGLHPFTLYFFQGAGGAELSVRYDGPGFGKQEIPSDALFTTE